jgi:pantothenate kinase-related protein Tda10
MVVPRIVMAKEKDGYDRRDVVPLSALNLELHELWRVYIPLAMIIDDLICEHERIVPNKAFVLGIHAPPGCGKSTLVELIKFLLLQIAEFENRGKVDYYDVKKQRVIVTVSQDDFYLTKADRKAKGIPSRMEMEGMDVDLCVEVLDLLSDRTRGKGAVVEVPRFSKAHDDREPIGTMIDEPVTAILFEGWRVSIDHPLYLPLIDVPDFLLSIDVNIDEVKGWKFEQSRRDATAAGIEWDEKKASALEKAWDEKIVPVISEYSPRVQKRADLVLSKGVGHVVTKIAGRISAFVHETHPDYHR